jgi:hypothetical protein
MELAEITLGYTALFQAGFPVAGAEAKMLTSS